MSGFVFTEAKVRKGSEPFKTGAYPNLLIENFYFTKEHSKRTGLDYLQTHIEFREAETDRLLSFTGFNGFYSGVVEGDNWTFLNPEKEGKDRTNAQGLEIVNALLYLLAKTSYSAADLQKNLKVVAAKATNFKKEEIDVIAVPEFIGKQIGAVITRIEHGYEKEGEWQDTERVRFEQFFRPKDMKNAYEAYSNLPASYVEEFKKEYDEDYVEPLWDKALIALKEKLTAFKPTSSGAVDGANTSSSPANGGLSMGDPKALLD